MMVKATIAGITGVMLAALTLAGVASAQPPVQVKSDLKATAATLGSPSSTGEEMASERGTESSIKVHGHWVLQVKNADGTLGDRREFENSLVTDDTAVSGNQLLYLLLSGNGVAGAPVVVFGVNPIPAGKASQECNGPQVDVPSIQCYGITTPRSPILTGSNGLSGYNPVYFSGVQSGLVVTVNVSSNVSLVLAGNFIVPSNVSSFAFVQTVWPVCTGASIPEMQWLSQPDGGEGEQFSGDPSVNRSTTMGPYYCNNSASFTQINPLVVGPLTSTNIPSGPLAVTPGQSIQVTVTISFS